MTVSDAAVSDATIEAEDLKNFFKRVGKATVNFGTKVANNPVRAVDIASKIGSAAASKNHRAPLSATPNFIKFATTGEGIICNYWFSLNLFFFFF